MRSKMIIDLAGEVKKYIEKNSIYSPKISMAATDGNYPKVIIDKTDENTLSRDNLGERSVRNFITIQIYTKQVKIGNKAVSAKTMELEIEDLIKDVMEKKYNFDLTSDVNFDHALDSEIYRKVMTYRICTFRN